MRAGPLSNPKVIDVLNRYFVPVYTVNDEYARNGSAPAGEKAERERIFREGYAAKMSVGTVHVYILNPEGHLIDSMHVADASKPEQLLATLNKAVAALQIKPGPPAVTPCPQSCAPSSGTNGLTLHLVARLLEGKGAWGGIPGEDWIVLDPREQQALFSSVHPKVGDTWSTDHVAAEKILTHFYPATENNDVRKNRFETLELKATVGSVDHEIARVRLEGRFRMQHSFYHKDDDKMVDATVIGFMDFDLRRKRAISFQMITDKATYNGGQFAVGVNSL